MERRPAESAFFVKARLQEGVTIAQAQAAMSILGTRLASEYPKDDPGKGIAVFASSDVRIHPQMDGLLAATASLLLVVVGLVLAIACSNLATLLLVRGAARAKEISVRLALGATRRQLVLHLLTESLLLSLAGGLTGCILAWWAIRSFAMLELPMVVDLSLDHRVLLFAVGLSLVTGVAFGLAPALKATRIDLVPALRGDGEARSPEHRWLTLRNALVVLQVAVSVVLLGGTSIVLQMLSASRSGRVGFAIDGIAMLETDARYAGHSASGGQPVRGASTTGGCDSRSAIGRAHPGPAHADGGRAGGRRRDHRDCRTERAAGVAGAIWAGPGYFDTLRIPILFGRALDERDRRDTPRVAVISETMARRYFGAEHAASVVGRRFRLERDTDANAWIEVVGVARDTGTGDLQGDLIDPTPELLYRSFAQWGLPPTTVLARTSLDARRPRRCHAARTCGGGPHVARPLGEDDGSASRGIARRPEGSGDVSRCARCPGRLPRWHRTLCRHRLCRVAAIA